jgi:hypothetical protein
MPRAMWGRSVGLIFLLAARISVAAPPTPPALTGFPFTDEDLAYSVNWPSGITLGEAHLRARHSGSDWTFNFAMDAGVPGFQVKDTYRAEAVPDFCSTSFDRTTAHGSRATDEQENIDRARSIAVRTTLKGGGKSDVRVPDCVKDALTYLFYARREMGQGRVPTAQQILFGGLYQIRVDYTGAPMIAVKGKQVQSDKVSCTIKGPNSETKFDIYFARDPARTPLVIKAPLAMGTFSMELLR